MPNKPFTLTPVDHDPFVQKTADIPDAHYAQIERLLSLHAQGEIAGKEVHAGMPEGYKVDLRKGSYDYEVMAPDGSFHNIAP